MSTKRAIVFGGGSAGSRHARLLIAAGISVDIFDPDPARAQQVEGVRYVDDDQLDAHYDVSVIASPSVFHATQLKRALDISEKVLVEKPIATISSDVQELAHTENQRIMVGYNLRFHEPIVKFMDQYQQGVVGDPLFVKLWFGYLLPSWRPTDYRESYSAHKSLGGGVLLDAIHELDLLLWIAKEAPTPIAAEIRNTGSLEIDTEDVVVSFLELDNTLFEVSLDYLSHDYRRGIEIIGTDGLLRLDWRDHSLQLIRNSSSQIEIIDTPVELSYARQTECFLDFVDGKCSAPVDALTALKSLELSESIRAAAR